MISGITINPQQFKKLSRIVYKESGVILDDKKYNLLVARLSKRMRKTKTSSVSEYIQMISNQKDEFNNFIDATTTNHTFFFRENKHCEYMINNLDNSKPLKIWSAASSSGEEAFSIAVQLLAHSFSFTIHASDISDSMLEIARRAVYPMDRIRIVPKPILQTYFQKGKGRQQGNVKVKPEIQKYVKFEKFNLLSGTAFDKFDIIFCRNVMIYFDSPTRQKVVDTLCDSLNPGGYFFVGLSENLHGLKHKLSTVLPSGYRKK